MIQLFLLLFENMPPKSKEIAIKYGYYQMIAGTPFKFWNKTKFDSIILPRPSLVEKIIYRIYACLQ